MPEIINVERAAASPIGGRALARILAIMTEAAGRRGPIPNGGARNSSPV